MIAVSYIQKEDTIYYLYKLDDLEKYYEHGFKEGTTGSILYSYNLKTKIKVYKCFGTINAPINHITSISLKHNTDFDEEFDPFFPDKPVTTQIKEYRFMLLDFNSLKNTKE